MKPHHTIQRLTIRPRSGNRAQMILEDDQGLRHAHLSSIDAPHGWHGEYRVIRVGDAGTMPVGIDEWIEQHGEDETA